MPRLKANGVELYYELHGRQDSPVLVLSNGILMSTASWAVQLPALSRHYRVLLYDCRGQWQSEHPPGPYSMEMHAQDLAALLAALDIRRAHICGISYGAELSMAFAARFPELTRCLVVSSAVCRLDPLLRAIAEEWLAAAVARDADRLFRITYPMNFSGAWIAANAAALEAARQRYRDIDFAALQELLRCFLGMDITDKLSAIMAPTLVMVGELDMLKPRRHSELIAGAIRGAELVVVPGCGHSLCWERPTLFNSLILGFLAAQDK
jgi:3-oxoadipate enol-lactonase